MEDQSKVLLDPAVDQYRQVRLAHWEGVAARMDTAKSLGGYYHRRLSQIYQRLIPPGYRVIEFGGGQGNLLASLKPSYGVAVDFSPEMIQRGRMNHPELDFLLEDVHSISLKESFDYIIMSDILNDVWDVQKVFEQAQRLSGPKTRLIINTYSRLWEVPLGLARKLGLAGSVLQQNWLTVEDIINLGHLADFEPINHWQEFLWPFGTPIISSICNRYLVKLWPINQLGLANFIVLRPKPNPAFLPPNPSVSVIVPARNEEGNIEEIFTRTPEMGNITELIFVEGHSTDHTYQEVEKWIAQSPQRPCKLLKQTGVGKGDAIRFGLSQASGDVVMILDADLTVAPKDLPKFYNAIASGKGEFINGSRFVYPREKEAMRFLRMMANKFFSLLFTWILGKYFKDTLCGTKVIFKSDYEKLKKGMDYFGDFDRYGDYDLILGSYKQNLKIVEIPVHYKNRTYGSTNIGMWKGGTNLLRTAFHAMKKIKFI
jgi:SAM-dependent methyltransferase